MSITMKDIARKAGVSVQTVSRAFNNRHDIGHDTRNRIYAIAKKLNYHPNLRARSHRTKKSKTLGIIVPDFRDLAYAELLQGCSNVAGRRGYQLLVFAQIQKQVDVNADIEAFKTLTAHQVDGLLIQPEHEDRRFIRMLRESKIPYVLYSRYGMGPQSDFVTGDHEAGAYLAARYLFEKGHSQIHYLIRTPRNKNVRKRIDGCHRAAKEKGFTDVSIALIDCIDEVEDAYKKTRGLLDQADRPRAIFTWDDTMAVGAARAILEKGLRIPQDVALVGHNDVEIARYLNPPLTTVAEGILNVGEKAAELLIQKIENKKCKIQRIILEQKLVARQTA